MTPELVEGETILQVGTKVILKDNRPVWYLRPDTIKREKFADLAIVISEKN